MTKMFTSLSIENEIVLSNKIISSRKAKDFSAIVWELSETIDFSFTRYKKVPY